MDKFDVVVVGAGVVGLAIAARLSQQFPRVLIIDKNASFGEETSSRNSEVIHAGIYYPQNSLKARFCVQGKERLYQYCQQRHIPHQRIGKLLCAHNDTEEGFLEQTQVIAKNNGVDDLVWQSSKQLKQLEPELSATAALLSPSTGIIDVHIYMQSLLAQLEEHGGLFVGNTELLGASSEDKGFTVKLSSVGETMNVQTRFLINSAGLHSTKVAASIAGLAESFIPQLHYCRGHYFSYSGKSPFNHLIYPIPEANGLGIHASLDVGGQLKFGPDTQYVDNLDYSVGDNLKSKFHREVKKYFPNITLDKLQPAYAGIRPKLQGEKDGFCDFSIQTQTNHGLDGLINLFGIDSPGLTSSIAIAEHIAEILAAR